ncbi:MAG TPA: hypothetical protein VM327_05575 [Candidatus Thermoplasmatota archaeon]|nr:hypothetical protein [Candidatus Thermoplasmatota archaeon]
MDEDAPGRRPTKVVIGGIALFLVAVFLARLLIEGGAAWVAFAACVPILLFILSAAVSFRFALAVTVVFTLGVLGLRLFLERAPTGWIPLLLLPVVAFTAMLAGRVLAQMKRDRMARMEHEGADQRGP